jgi:hypothetical protein
MSTINTTPAATKPSRISEMWAKAKAKGWEAVSYLYDNGKFLTGAACLIAVIGGLGVVIGAQSKGKAMAPVMVLADQTVDALASQVTRLEGGMLVRSARGLENADGAVRSRLGFGE